jgi:hypothetical protein
VTLAAQYGHDGAAAAYMGNTQLLPDGNMFVGWGELPYFSEYSASGKLLLDGVFPAPDLSYRANQVPSWTGLPLSPPNGAARRGSNATTVYASWNGATQVRSWRVLAGSSGTDLAVAATSAKSGFETAIRVPAGSAVFKVQALNTRGQVIGTSRPFNDSAANNSTAGTKGT